MLLGSCRSKVLPPPSPGPAILGSLRPPSGPQKAFPLPEACLWCSLHPVLGGSGGKLTSTPLRKTLSANPRKGWRSLNHCGERGRGAMMASSAHTGCVCARARVCDINHCPHPSPTQATTDRCATVPSKCLRWALQPGICAENE